MKINFLSKKLGATRAPKGLVIVQNPKLGRNPTHVKRAVGKIFDDPSMVVVSQSIDVRVKESATVKQFSPAGCFFPQEIFSGKSGILIRHPRLGRDVGKVVWVREKTENSFFLR